jgi:hypothetical protein
MGMIFVIIQLIWREKMVVTIVVLLLLSNFNVVLMIILDDFDNVYIAHCYPYTYSQLQKYLRII